MYGGRQSQRLNVTPQWRDHLKRDGVLNTLAHFQKEWQTGASMGALSIMGSFGGAVARAKISRSRKSTWTETETLKIMKQKR